MTPCTPDPKIGENCTRQSIERIPQEDQVRRLPANVAGAARGDAGIGRRERGAIVQPVPGHQHPVSGRLQPGDGGLLVGRAGRSLGHKPGLPRHFGNGGGVIARKDRGLDPQRPQFGQRLRGGGLTHVQMLCRLDHRAAVLQCQQQLQLAQARMAHPVVQTGQFAADMKVALVNDGPVTIPMRMTA